MTQERYNDLALVRRFQRFRSIGVKIEDDALHILELFAQTERLTISQVTRLIKSSIMQRAYKNVHNIVVGLKSLGLIEEVLVEKYVRRPNEKYFRHNEKYLRLTDEGIFQIFLKNRYHGILVDQLPIRKYEDLSDSNISNFLKYHGNNLIFQSFLYPYFEKRTISELPHNLDLLIRLFPYLHDCCSQVENAIRSGTAGSYQIPRFSWNRVPGDDNEALLNSLKEIFTLDLVENVSIEKARDNNAIKITTTQLGIIIKLDSIKSKAIATATSEGKIGNYEYRILKFGSEIIACTPESTEKLIKGALDVRSLIEFPFHKLISDLGRTDTKDRKNILEALSADSIFMQTVENMHSDFENGYQRLMNARKKLDPNYYKV